MRFLVKGWGFGLALFFPALLGAQAAPAPVITVTPGLISASIGTSLYCAMRIYKDPQYQIYCYTSINTPWDTIVKNALDTIPVISAANTAPGGTNLPATTYYALNSTGPVSQHQSSWLVWRDANGIHWQVTIDTVWKAGTADASGNFQTAQSALPASNVVQASLFDVLTRH